MRDPWYSVPDVKVPDFFLSYMSGLEPNLVRNDAGCTCTNSVHSVRMRSGVSMNHYLAGWKTEIVRLSCELEGHPLGGGMLKLEPGEASKIVLPGRFALRPSDRSVLAEAVDDMRSWRHYASAA